MLKGPYGLIGLIREAWARVRRGMDEGELAKRLARRGMVNFGRPPRAWCLVVRASDTRITPMRALIMPQWAADRRRPAEHTVVLEQRLVRRLCAPVLITPPGELLNEVAAKLGSTPGNLTKARCRGVFSSHYLRMAGGGVPVPLLYTDRVLDPSGPMFRADTVWNLTGEFLPGLMAEGFEQTVVRVPRFAPARGLKGYAQEGAKRRSYRLPPVPPDYVWYKWKNGVFVGDAGDRKRAEERKRRARREKRPRTSVARGSLRFNGWSFLCPGCKKEVRRLYCPLPGLGLRVGVDERRERNVLTRHTGVAALPSDREPLHAFACHSCHRVRSASLWSESGWNLFIGHVSGGLLYGHEVARPASPEVRRVRAHRPQVNRTAAKRQAVLEGFMKGKTVRQVAAEMGLSRGAVQKHLHLLCRQERVANRVELVKKMGGARPAVLNVQERAAERRRRVVELIRAGLRYGEICRRLSMGKELWYDMTRLWREHGVEGLRGSARRRALAEKLGVGWRETRGEMMRRRVAELRGAGLTWKEVARELGVSFSGAYSYARFLKAQAERVAAG